MKHCERDDRLMAVKKAREWASTNFVILDTETTGLDRHARIVEFSCIDRAGTVLVNSLVNPGVPIPRRPVPFTELPMLTWRTAHVS